jgi:hypothetical protein
MPGTASTHSPAWPRPSTATSSCRSPRSSRPSSKTPSRCVIAANAHAGRPRSAAAATAAPEIGCLTKRLTNSLVLAGRDDTRWTGRLAKRLLNLTRWTLRHPLDGVLVAHNPKVAGSNPAPATNCAKAKVAGPFREIGEGLRRSQDDLRVRPTAVAAGASCLVSTASRR